MKTILIGLGNPILTDDGVGVLVARRVKDMLISTPGEEIDVTEAAVGGLRLAELMEGYDRAIVVDAAILPPPSVPGRCRRFSLVELEAFCPALHTASAHDTTFPLALKAVRQAGLSVPDEVIFYGVEVCETDLFSDKPSAQVSAAIPRIAARVIRELAPSTRTKQV